MILVKVGRTDRATGIESFSVYECEHFEAKKVKPGCLAAQPVVAPGETKAKPMILPGIYFELVRGRTVTKIELPRDGDVVYITNDNGRTGDTYRWPIE